MKKIIGASSLFIFFALAPLFVSGGSLKTVKPESVGMSSEKLAALKDHFAQLVDEERSGGYQLVVSRRGKVVMHENLGMSNVAESVPIGDDTLFRIYSMTKPVMGVAMMMLYEEGHFAFSDPIAKFIPELKDLKVYAGEDSDGEIILEEPGRAPTIHDLLQHTAGFTYGIFGDTAVDRLYRERGLLDYDKTSAEKIEILSAIPLLYQPGSRWVYSVSVDLQGYIIEKLTGIEAGEFLRRRIFEPLGMDETMAFVPAEKAGVLADVYTHDEDGRRILFEGPFALDALRPPAAFSGGAQLISTGDDYWRFCQMLLNGGAFQGKRYLSPRTVDMMTTNRLDDDNLFRPGMGYGLNFGVVTDATKADFAASNGEFYWGGMATTVFWVDPAEELIVIMMSQYFPYEGPRYSDLLHRLVRASIIE
jgi:CubicO group peptidase (beta-lactamase class C family)